VNSVARAMVYVGVTTELRLHVSGDPRGCDERFRSEDWSRNDFDRDRRRSPNGNSSAEWIYYDQVRTSPGLPEYCSD
jgi:hypothetical protein